MTEININHIQNALDCQQKSAFLQSYITPVVPISHVCSQTSLDSQKNSEDIQSIDQNQPKNSDQRKSCDTKQNKTQTDIQSFQELILKNIKSKEEIQIQSKQNQQILKSLNSNLDDLFKKISQLTDEITTESPVSLAYNLKQKQKATSLTQIPIDNTLQNRQFIKENMNGLFNSSNNILIKQKDNYITLKNVVSSKTSGKIMQPKYKSIFFSNNQSNFRQSSINMRLFQTGKSLGCGKFGEVLQCRQNKTSTLYALKKIFKSAIKQYEMEEQIITQIKILSIIDHPNIIKAYESFTDQFHIFILMEYVQGKSLTTKFKSPEKEVRILIKQVLQALSYLHQKKIAHRDIKPENIIITEDNTVKICDFGWSSIQSQQMNIICGTLDYVCPQMVNNEVYTQKVDLWNIGILTYQLLFGVAPFKSSTKSKTFQKVKNMDYGFAQDVKISPQCKQFIEGFLQPEISRKSLDWGLNHIFLSQNIETITQSEHIKKSLTNQFNAIINSQVGQRYEDSTINHINLVGESIIQ